MPEIKFSKTGLCFRDGEDDTDCILNSDALTELCLKCHKDNSISTLTYHDFDDSEKEHMKTHVESLLQGYQKRKNDHWIPKSDYKQNRYVS